MHSVNEATVEDILAAALLCDAQDNSRKKLMVILDVHIPRTYGVNIPRLANEVEADLHHRIKTSWEAMGPDPRKAYVLDERVVGQLEYGAWAHETHAARDRRVRSFFRQGLTMGLPGAARIVDGVAGNDSLATVASDIVTNQDNTAVQGMAEALEKLKHTMTLADPLRQLIAGFGGLDKAPEGMQLALS